MYTRFVAGSLLAALSLVAPLHGQRVAADVVVRSGPVAGHVVIGDGYSTYRRPVAVHRRAPVRVIVIERDHHRRHRHPHQWARLGYRPVALYYLDGRYYDRPVRRWPAMREVVVYERGGRFYRECDHDHRWNERDDWRDHRDHGRDHDD